MLGGIGGRRRRGQQRMRWLDASQICYLDLSEGDSAVVYRKEDPNVLSRALTSLNHGVYAVVEYFD